MSAELEQQRDIGKAFREISDLRGDVKELRTALVGIDGHNGLRGELREFMERFEDSHKEYGKRIDAVEERVEEGISYGKHLWEVERNLPGGCIGKVALDEYRNGLEQKERRSEDLGVELKKSRIAMLVAILVAVMTSATSLAVALINAGGKP